MVSLFLLYEIIILIFYKQQSFISSNIKVIVSHGKVNILEHLFCGFTLAKSITSSTTP